MNVTREEAAEALTTIDQAGRKVGRLQGYHYGAPFFLIWGLVWMVANTVSQFWPHYQAIVWPASTGAGVVLSTALGFIQGNRGVANAGKRSDGWRIGLTTVVIFGFIATMILIAAPETSRQGNAMVSVFFPFVYMAAGVWWGWRLFVVGLVTAAAIIVGYFWIEEYFSLWMGVFGGGSLIAGAIWLRTA